MESGVDIQSATPANEESSVKDWKNWFTLAVKDFRGNVDNAALLMASFTEGRDYLFSALTKKGLVGVERPNVEIIVSGGPIATATSNWKDKAILVKKSILESFSQYDMNKIYQLKDLGLEVAFEGRIPDGYRLMGVEETHHNLFGQVKGDLPSANNFGPMEKSLKEYDSKDEEYRALRWQLKYAKEKEMPYITVHVLQNRLDSAINFRGNKTTT